jgi:UDP-2,4-diacetamido-2,4,6-trideoxy-beta-L-altropyranose hydrolase
MRMLGGTSDAILPFPHLSDPNVRYVIISHATRKDPTMTTGSLKSHVTLRPVCPDDMMQLLEWQYEPGARTFMRNPRLPTEDEHRAWFARRVTERRGLFDIIVVGAQDVGVVRCDSVAPGVFEIAIFVSGKHRGKGVARSALRLAASKMPHARIIAHVLDGNEASRRAFTAAGYSEVGPGQFVSEPGACGIKNKKGGALARPTRL